MLDQAAHKVKSGGNLFRSIIQGGGGRVGPLLAVHGFQIKNHQDHSVVARQMQGVIIILQDGFKSFSCVIQIFQRFWIVLQTCFAESRHVPVENAPGH